MSHEVEVLWQEDGTATVYGLICARDGSGTSIRGKGKALQRTDITSITFKAYDVEIPEVVINSGTLDKNLTIFDTLQTSDDDSVWQYEQGFNFRHDLAPANFPTGGRKVQIEYTFTTSGGAVGYAKYVGMVDPLYSS
jgi:hypothetical protein